VRETGRGIHIHVAEDGYDPSYARHISGTSVLRRLDRHGLLGPRAILAHGVHLDRDDVELLNERDAFLVHNPRSNMNNAVGYATRLGSVRNAALGTDGIGGDMIAEAQVAHWKARDAGRSTTADETARLLCRGNEVAARVFGEPFGRIEPGSVADFVVLDYDAPTPLSEANASGHLVFGLSSRHVRDAVVGGREIYRDRRFPMDVTEVYERAREQARRLWERVDRL
jgi:cytosine/adenosine deaminase-related metal-dependent hydrolase